MKFISSLAIAASLSACVAPAFAQSPNCYPREAAVSGLTNTHGESVVAYGASSNVLVEFWGSEETGSWTITTTDTEGRMCIAAVGFGFTLGDDHIAKGVEG